MNVDLFETVNFKNVVAIVSIKIHIFNESSSPTKCTSTIEDKKTQTFGIFVLL